MVGSGIEHYRPTRNAWKAVCIAFICVTAMVWWVCESNIRVKVKGAYDVNVSVGEATQDITVHQHIKQKLGL